MQSTSGTAYTGLPRPERVFVYDFAVTPDEVKLDQGISADIMRYVSHGGTSARTAELAKKTQNPVADLISVPLHVQPVIPIKLSEDWNLITQFLLPK